MKERPILFNDEMVRAILDGRKTQTRRSMKPQPEKRGAFWEWGGAGWSLDHGVVPVVQGHSMSARCPYGQPGDRLWVREAHAFVPTSAYAHSEGVQQTINPHCRNQDTAAIYRQGWERSTGGFRWRPSIHMPRWASRLLLEVTAVRVERLQDITEADAIAEGGPVDSPCGLATGWFADLWDKINGDDAWGANPWVWVVEFQRVEPEVAHAS